MRIPEGSLKNRKEMVSRLDFLKIQPVFFGKIERSGVKREPGRKMGFGAFYNNLNVYLCRITTPNPRNTDNRAHGVVIFTTSPPKNRKKMGLL